MENIKDIIEASAKVSTKTFSEIELFYNKEFVKFLRENDALKNFIINIRCKEDHQLLKPAMICKNFNEFFSRVKNPFNYIWDAFFFSYSPQKPNYWSELQEKWINHINDLRKNQEYKF